MKKHSRDQWLSLVKETEYALDHSGTMVFLSVLLIGAHLLHSPSYARIVLAVVLLLCLMPKAVCGFYRMKKPCRSERRAPARSMSTRSLTSRPLDFERMAWVLKAGLRRTRAMAVAMAVTSVAVLFSALMLSTANAFLDQHIPIPEATMPPRLIGNYFITGDQARLPMRSWLPEGQPVKAVLVAVHGFNDYSAFFEAPGNYFKTHGIASYAYDQRGFGGAPGRGSWAGIQLYIRDLSDFIRLIRERHPGVPLYVLGESMGAAELMVALTGKRPPAVEGVILSAPAVGEWETMPWYLRAGLWTGAHTVPWVWLTGENLHLVPSDNLPMRRALYLDPLVLKGTHIGTLYKLANLMNQASEQARRLNQSTLILYGERDQFVPKASIYRLLKSRPQGGRWHVAVYPQGYHLLLRDLEAPRLWQDIAAWIEAPTRGLPSGADRRAAAVLGGA